MGIPTINFMKAVLLWIRKVENVLIKLYNFPGHLFICKVHRRKATNNKRNTSTERYTIHIFSFGFYCLFYIHHNFLPWVYVWLLEMHININSINLDNLKPLNTLLPDVHWDPFSSKIFSAMSCTSNLAYLVQIDVCLILLFLYLYLGCLGFRTVEV